MSIPPPDQNMLNGFLDDYFAECDEHLAAIRRNILDIEAARERGQGTAASSENLFRSFHTIKGLSGMVGSKDAERLAHQIESYLDAVRNGRAILAPAALNAVIAGVNILEQVIAARREHGPPPRIEAALAQLAALLPEDGAAEESPPPAPAAKATATPPGDALLDLREQERGLLAEARQQGASLWRCEFAPSRELADRNVNVNAIRGRLEKAGRIIHAAPRVLPAGGIAFEFLAVFPAGAAPPGDWQADGLTCRPYETAPPAAAAAGTAGGGKPAATAAPGPPDEKISAAAIAPANIVRIDLSRLDEFMRLVGELVISRSRLEEGLKRLEGKTAPAQLRPLQETNLAMERQLRELREAVMRIRLVPVAEIFNRMQFVVRDAARESGKQVALTLTGQETEIDKLIVERMMDPLLHLVRNAVSHGLEAPEARRDRGKPAAGRLTLRAATAGELVVMAVADDGAGLDMEAIAAQAVRAGILPAGTGVDEQSVLDVLCAPGFSTRAAADLTSGRGVGLTVVRAAVQELGGTLAVSTRRGEGTRFTVSLPLTLAIADALIVAAGDQVFAAPQALIHEVIEIAGKTVTAMENNELIPYRGGVLPLLRLRRLFRLAGGDDRARHGLVIGTGRTAVVLAVDRILGRREIVVRASSDPLLRVPGVSGATELGDGRVVLILDAAHFLRGKQPA